jgi:hypothetical protein
MQGRSSLPARTGIAKTGDARTHGVAKILMLIFGRDPKAFSENFF